METNEFFRRIGNWCQEHAATLLSWGATIGTIGGSVLAAKGVSKAQDRIHNAYIKKVDKVIDDAHKAGLSEEEIDQAIDNTNLIVWEKIKAGAPAFIPAALVEAATIGCIHGSNILNKKEINKARDALTVAVAGFAAYRESVGAITDRTTEVAAAKRVEMMKQSEQNGDPPWSEKQLFAITFPTTGVSECFEMSMKEVFDIEYRANRIFALRGYLTENELRGLLGLKEVEGGNDVGWQDYIGEVYYGYHWIDFCHDNGFLPDGRSVVKISLPFAPHPMNEDVIERMFEHEELEDPVEAILQQADTKVKR